MYIFQLEDSRANGASHIKILPGRLVVARLDGLLDFLDIVTSPGSGDAETVSPMRSRLRLISTDRWEIRNEIVQIILKIICPALTASPRMVMTSSWSGPGPAGRIYRASGIKALEYFLTKIYIYYIFYDKTHKTM